MEVLTWIDVAVRVQSALGAAKPITAITKANPAVATSAAHGFADGDVVLLKVSGMRQLNYIVARIDASDENSFALEGIDSTLFGTFVSGTAEKITFGLEAETFQDVSSSGGEPGTVDVQTLHDAQAFSLPGNISPLVFTFNSLWNTDDPVLAALGAASRTRQILGVQFEFPNGAKLYFAATPASSGAPGGQAGQPVTTGITLNVRGRALTAYAN